MSALFTFDEARCRELIAAGQATEEIVDCIEPIDPWQDSPDELDGAVAAALDFGAIRSAKQHAGIGVYPMSCGDQQPVLSVGLADGTPNLLDPHDWQYPDEDVTDGVEVTVAVLAWMVERANQLVAEAGK
jgi:hypothetical protein